MTKLILIRHGLSETNEKKILAGHLDTPLAEKGIHQAEITAQYVCEKYKVDAIYSSDLKRAKMTAEKIADITKKDIVISENLRELFAGEWEGKKSKDLPILYPEQYYLWINDIGKSHCEGGETIQQLYDRINNEIDKIISENQSKTVVIVSHATAIRAFMVRVFGIKVENMQQIDWVPNASVSEFDVENGKITPVIIGENSFHGKLGTNVQFVI